MKKIFSIILCFTMIFSLTGNALAAELQLENQYADTAMVTLSDEIDLKITIIQKP